QVLVCFLTDGAGRLPTESAVAKRDALLAEDAAFEGGGVNRKRIEELVGEDHTAYSIGHRRIEIDGDVLPLGERFRHFTPAGAELDHGEPLRFSHGVEPLADAGGHKDSEHRLNLLRGEEISMFAEGIAGAAVVAVLGVIQRHLHELAERDRAVAKNPGCEELSGRSHGRPSRLCGVWRNISTR